MTTSTDPSSLPSSPNSNPNAPGILGRLRTVASVGRSVASASRPLITDAVRTYGYETSRQGGNMAAFIAVKGLVMNIREGIQPPAPNPATTEHNPPTAEL